MASLTIPGVRARARQGTSANFSVSSALQEHIQKQASLPTHDIFLSHAFADRELVLGAAFTLEDYGHTVFIDWRDEPQLDRRSVNAKTATTLRQRIKSSRCLLYATTEHSNESRWMPWELGYKDGDNSRVGILPLQETASLHYAGAEYLGLYPFLAEYPDQQQRNLLWMLNSSTKYVLFKAWLNGEEPRERTG